MGIPIARIRSRKLPDPKAMEPIVQPSKGATLKVRSAGLATSVKLAKYTSPDEFFSKAWPVIKRQAEEVDDYLAKRKGRSERWKQITGTLKEILEWHEARGSVPAKEREEIHELLDKMGFKPK
jgi:hypothetical protein